MGGYIKIPRDLFDPLFGGFSRERFSRREAFIDLVQMAAHKPRTVILSGREVRIGRGEVAASMRFLATRWMWNTGTVVRFINLLCGDGLCERRKSKYATVLSIVRYDDYDGNDDIPQGKHDVKQEADSAAEKKRTAPKTDKEAVERLYKLYPTKCVVTGRNLGKSSKDKEKIARILADVPEKKIAYTIKRYVDDCTMQKTYMKNFSTFLNNLPDYADDQERDQRGIDGPESGMPPEIAALPVYDPRRVEYEVRLQREASARFLAEKEKHEKK